MSFPLDLNHISVQIQEDMVSMNPWTLAKIPILGRDYHQHVDQKALLLITIKRKATVFLRNGINYNAIKE